jgi:hypothetical protein
VGKFSSSASTRLLLNFDEDLRCYVRLLVAEGHEMNQIDFRMALFCIFWKETANVLSSVL